MTDPVAAGAAPDLPSADPAGARGDVRPGQGDPVSPGRFLPLVPRQLPEPLIRLWGRETELNALDALLADGGPGPVTALLCGPPGAGKTALAVRWLYQHRDRAPDGQLYAGLAGVLGLAEGPHQVLGRWLRALGVPAAWVPPGTATGSGCGRRSRPPGGWPC